MAVDTTQIEAAKKAKRMTTNAFDDEVQRLLETAELDLGIAGVEIPETASNIVLQAKITFFLMHFGEPDNYDRLKASYDEQKAQLATCTGFTDWLGVDGNG